MAGNGNRITKIPVSMNRKETCPHHPSKLKVRNSTFMYFHWRSVAPITQITHMRNKNSNIKGRSCNVVKVIFHTKINGTALKGKNLLPVGANFFL